MSSTMQYTILAQDSELSKGRVAIHATLIIILSLASIFIMILYITHDFPYKILIAMGAILSVKILAQIYLITIYILEINRVFSYSIQISTVAIAFIVFMLGIIKMICGLVMIARKHILYTSLFSRWPEISILLILYTAVANCTFISIYNIIPDKYVLILGGILALMPLLITIITFHLKVTGVNIFMLILSLILSLVIQYTYVYLDN